MASPFLDDRIVLSVCVEKDDALSGKVGDPLGGGNGLLSCADAFLLWRLLTGLARDEDEVTFESVESLMLGDDCVCCTVYDL